MGIFSKKNTDRSGPPQNEADDAGQTKTRMSALEKANATLTEKLRHGFDAAYYLTRNPDVLAANTDPFEHYLNFGWREGRRPNSWFDPDAYTVRYADEVDIDTNPFVHFMMHRDRLNDGLRDELSALRLKSRVMYWADMYQDRGDEDHRPIIITASAPSKDILKLVQPKFDAEYYMEQNPDLVDKVSNPLMHFMTLGWIEGRDPNSDFSVSYYLRKNKDVQRQGVNPYVHYLKHGHTEKWRVAPSVADAKVLALFEYNPDMEAIVAKAKALDPMVAMPIGRRVITSPLKVANHTADVAHAMRCKLAGKTYKYIVAVPHVRMSGASRVASIFAEALAQVRDPSEILVITTDSSEIEYIKWFSSDLDIFDLSKEIVTLTEEDKIRALIDLMRGVDAHVLINVNSRLVWEAMRLFGRQLHHEFRILTYLFTWDENIKGDRVGYPIQWLRDTADYHHLLMTDTQNLTTDVSNRLGFEQGIGEGQVIPLYTPITGEAAVANLDVTRGSAGHFLWAGRFDPQKRLDLLVAIARANPDMTFDVYGKTVLGKDDLSFYNPPENIIPKGTYTDLQEVLETPYTGFLYTAQWDGLPTILLDMAAAGLPIAASNVGGIAEMLDGETGWLIADFEDIDSYSVALREMAANPDEAQSRVAALQKRLADQFARDGYINKINELVSKHDL